MASEADSLAAVNESGGRAGSEGGGLRRLPPGRHGLPREFVTQNQRDRLAAGIIAVVAERGYHDATITQIAAAAGVSRRTFYRYFSSKEKCFLDTYRMISDFLFEAMATAGKAEVEWTRRVRTLLAVLLESFTANPDLVHFCLIAPPSAGGEIAASYSGFLAHLLEVLEEGRPADVRKPSEAAELGLVGGFAALVVDEVRKGGGERLPELLPDLVELVLTPYVGREAAARAGR